MGRSARAPGVMVRIPSEWQVGTQTEGAGGERCTRGCHTRGSRHSAAFGSDELLHVLAPDFIGRPLAAAFLIQKPPIGVYLPDERFLSLPRPVFDFFFAGNGVVDVLVCFHIHQAIAEIPPGKGFLLAPVGVVFYQAAGYAVGDAGV